MKKEKQTSIPFLVVDLDNSLVRADLFAERLARIMILRPWLLIGFIASRQWSIPALKQWVARKIILDPKHLPYNEDLLEKIKRAKANGTTTILATAAHETYARTVAEHLDLFDEVLASDGSTNLKGTRKLEAIREATNGQTFAYAGDSTSDFPIFSEAALPLLVGGSWKIRNRFSELYPSGESINWPNPSTCFASAQALRPHQWAKNLLIFLPAAVSINLYDAYMALMLIPAFVVFSLCSSLVYLVNDIGDIDADREHPKKKARPFASGMTSVGSGAALATGLVAAIILVSITFLQEHLWLFGAYLITSWLYSARLKEFATVDVFILAFLYVVRVIAGAEVLYVHYTSWFVIFIVFTFLSLGWLKRFTEIRDTRGDLSSRRRGYGKEDEQIVLGSGLACAFSGLIILFLYTASSEVATTYRHPQGLLLLGVPYLYLLLELWRTAAKGKLHHDPVSHVLGSPSAYAAGLAGIIIILLSRF